MKGIIGKMKRPKPAISLDDKDLPAIKDWEVGKTYEIKAKIKMTFQSKGDEYEYMSEGGSENAMRARFRIIDIEPIGTSSKKSKMLPRKSKM